MCTISTHHLSYVSSQTAINASTELLAAMRTPTHGEFNKPSLRGDLLMCINQTSPLVTLTDIGIDCLTVPESRNHFVNWAQTNVKIVRRRYWFV
ncbi:hypothetical protein [Bifidobacterium sp. ESL0764]|uniref:hypothetical protein n=1 Tax=Bifidobacterium sp. ESL0764 TaxID=2983228 RepID=UPI0023F71B20|nr:hypothetical protein [Bifidobacterium sp. ESL0764]WEV65989.1 hypothetical protein OZX71_01110 [Bifidobacterium sp. ESL0764]